MGLVVLGAIVGTPKGTSTANSSTVAANSSDVAGLEVSAAEVYRAYEANEQAAQLKYGAQPVRISGEIASIELDAADEPMVSLRAGDMLEEVTLHFGSDFSATAAKLRKGEWFTAKCNTVSEMMGAPQLEDCTMLSAGNDE